MLNRQTRVALFLGAALTLPAFAQASNTWHQTGTEIGYEVALSHANGSKTAEQVQQELAQAKADKSAWRLRYLNAATPGWAKQGTSRTRAEVQAQAESITPEERARLKEIYTPG